MQLFFLIKSYSESLIDFGLSKGVGFYTKMAVSRREVKRGPAKHSAMKNQLAR